VTIKSPDSSQSAPADIRAVLFDMAGRQKVKWNLPTIAFSAYAMS